MSISVYSSATSVVAGSPISFHASSAPAGRVSVRVVRVGAAETEVFSGTANVSEQSIPLAVPSVGCGWPSAVDLVTSAGWLSGLYRATLTNAAGERDFAEFVLRPGTPAAPILVCVPFATFVAYNDVGGKSLYGNDDPNRSARVTFDRPRVTCSGYEIPFFPFFDNCGLNVEYCSSLDLHQDSGILSQYQLLVSIGHDEYWSSEMRDAVEDFVAGGGNAAFFSANTCWWQVRFEDANRTMVCYKDATVDPMTAESPRLATVRWFHAPVLRPENGLTGVSFRYGAGCWLDPTVMTKIGYTVRFARHWIFEGTGLADGDTFALGCVGYETDAADYEDTDGIPWATGRDGTPSGFVILATADLADWRQFGQGGSATMGIYERGGTVFTAATIGWSNGLTQPGPVTQITQNVLRRLAARWPGDNWQNVGEAVGITAMAAVENRIFGTAGPRLVWRPPVPQNLRWSDVDVAQNVVAMAVPYEAAGLRGTKLFAVTSDGALWCRDPVIGAIPWERIGDVPGVTSLAAINNLLFAGTGTALRFRDSTDNAAPWATIGATPAIVAMTAMNGRLFAVSNDKKLWSRSPVTTDVSWTEIASLPAVPSALAASGGRLYLAGDNHLWSAAPGFTTVAPGP